jgi:hypothetical protein
MHEGRKQNSFSSVRKRWQPQADGKGDIKHHTLKQKAIKGEGMTL